MNIAHWLMCNDLVDEIYATKYSEIYDSVARRYVKQVLGQGGKFAALADAEIAKAQALVQLAQTQQWLEGVAKPAGMDGARMQALIDAAIAKHSPQGSLKRPDELATLV